MSWCCKKSEEKGLFVNKDSVSLCLLEQAVAMSLKSKAWPFRQNIIKVHKVQDSQVS